MGIIPDALKLDGNLFKELPKPVVVGGLIGTTGLIGYLLWSHRKKTGSWFGGSAPAATGGTSALDPVTGLPVSQDNVVDPLTNMTYLAEATQYGSVATAEASVSAYGTGSDTGTGVGVQPASGGAGASTPAAGSVSSSTYTSNAAWAQAAIAGLEDVSGGPSYNGTDIGTAIGDYLEGQPITAAQAQVVNVALGEFGQPPTGGLSVILKPTAPVGTTQVTVPNVTGVSVEEAQPILSALKLRSSIDPNENIKGTVRVITSTTPAAGAKANPGSNVVLHWTPPAKKG